MSTLPLPTVASPSESYNKRLSSRLATVDAVLKAHVPGGDSDAALSSVDSLLKALGELEVLQATRTAPCTVVDAEVCVGGGKRRAGAAPVRAPHHPPTLPPPSSRSRGTSA